MKIKLILLFTVSLRLLNAQAVYYDTNYVKELTNRVLVSYFQEYRSLDMTITPNKSLDTSGKESLKLSSSSPLYSGFLIQYKAIAIYLAGNTAQSSESKSNYGVQNSNIWKISLLYKAIFTNFNYINYTGFYDKHFDKHQFSKWDGLPYERYQNMNTTWMNFDIKYYPGYKKFSQGIPTWFGLRQTKSKFSMGYKLSYNYLRLNNRGTAIFSDSLSKVNDLFTMNKSIYNGINLAIAPSLYLVAFKKLFLYVDGWVGLDAGQNKLMGDALNKTKTSLGFVFPEFRTALGFQNNRWIAATYYSYMNQAFSNKNISMSINYNTFGVIIGYRFYPPARLAL
jgi:hypothetical protein